jgi:branched-subunit amino acid ABC-type transport system permease component
MVIGLISDTFGQQLAGGLAFGVVYGLVALGFTMIIRALDLIHFGHGEMMMVGGLVGFSFTTGIGVPYVLAVPLCGVAAGLTGVILGLLIFLPLRSQGSPIINMMIATIGLSIVLQNLGKLIWGSRTLDYPSVFSSSPYQIGGVLVPSYVPWIVIVGVVLMVGLQAFFSRTATGIAMRGASEDPVTARLMGVDPNRMILYTLGISGALGGIAGALLSPIVFASFDMGISVGLKAFSAATIGGLGSMGGAMAGGVILGVVETIGAAKISSAYKDAFAYGLLILVLLIRPRGLFGGRKSGETMI